MANKTIKNLEMSGLIGDSEGNFDLFIPEQSGILIPPDVKVEGATLHFPPVPNNLHTYNHRDYLLYWLQQNGWMKANNVNTRRMFNDFLNLSKTHLYSQESIEKYKRFALKYGPLWESNYTPPNIQRLITRNIKIIYEIKENGERKEIRRIRSTRPQKKYSKLKMKSGGQIPRLKNKKNKKPIPIKRNRLKIPSWYKPGNWYGYEEVLRWHEKAMEIAAVFEVAIDLLENKIAPEEKWEPLKYEDASEYDIEIQRQLLSGIINSKLKRFVSLQTKWENGKFKVHVDTGLGFLGILWLHISQILTKNLMLCICDGCGRPYIRTGRKPQKGRHNFCGDCGHGDKASKRLYSAARKKGGL